MSQDGVQVESFEDQDAAAESFDAEETTFDSAVSTIHRRLRRRTDIDRVAAALLEDDLREGLTALEDVDTWFADVLRVLAEDACAADLVASADDTDVQERLDYLAGVVGSLRRRLGQFALRRRLGS